MGVDEQRRCSGMTPQKQDCERRGCPCDQDNNQRERVTQVWISQAEVNEKRGQKKIKMRKFDRISYGRGKAAAR